VLVLTLAFEAAGTTAAPAAVGKLPATTVTTATSVPATVPVSADPALVAAVRAEADWALQAQMADGAIGHYVDRVRVWPYLANFTALGLARATEVTGDARYAAGAWRWLGWYQAHQDTTGFVTDYALTNGVMTSTGDMDSTDAYAGTFLLAALRTWRATGDRTTLRTLRAGIGKAVQAIGATQDADGLTWAKPAWRVKYLMDQAETLAGLRAAVDLSRVLGDKTLERSAAAMAARMQTGIDGLWNPGTGSYDWAVHEDGARAVTHWDLLYPDALQQAWAVAFGAVPAARATELMARFGTSQPRWDQPGAVGGYWPVAGWAYLRVGDAARAARAATSIGAAATTAGRAWPYTPANAAQLIGLLSADPRLLG
jgi:hypothetical protein